MKTKEPALSGSKQLLLYFGDHPEKAFTLNLNKEVDQTYLRALIDLVNEETGWGLCEFKNQESYRKGKRLTGQHRQLRRSGKRDACGYRFGIQIGKFQGLVQPLGYKNLPLSKGEEKTIREEYRYRDYSVAKLADDWDVSESHIRKVLKGDKPPVCPSKDSTNKGIFEPKPPVPGRVVPESRGYAYE